MSKTYGWFSAEQAQSTGRVYVYATADGQAEAELTEATSRADYKPKWADAKSLGEVGRFLRVETREREPAAPAPSPATTPLASPPGDEIPDKEAAKRPPRGTPVKDSAAEKRKMAADAAAARQTKAAADSGGGTPQDGGTPAATLSASAVMTVASVTEPPPATLAAEGDGDSDNLDDLIGSLTDL